MENTELVIAALIFSTVIGFSVALLVANELRKTLNRAKSPSKNDEDDDFDYNENEDDDFDYNETE